MRVATLIGILLIVLGILGFIFGGFSYSRRHQDVNFGGFHVSHRESHNVPISPILSSIALVGGIVLVAVGGTRKSG